MEKRKNMKKIILLIGMLIFLTGFSTSAEEIISVSAPNNVTTALRITWKRNPKVDGYIIYRDGIRIKKLPNTINYYSNIKLEPGTKYSYQIQSFIRKKNGKIVYSKKGNVKTGITNLKMPILQEAWNYGSKIKLTWNPSENARAYKIYRKTEKSGWRAIGRSTIPMYVDRTTQSGISYYYTVRAYSLYDQREHLSSYNVNGIQPKNVTIKLNRQNVGLYIDLANQKSFQLTANITGKSQKVVWSSDDHSVATVSNGKVVAKGEGETRIYAKANGITTSCRFVVRKYKSIKEGVRLYSLGKYKEAQKIFSLFPKTYIDPTEKTMPRKVKDAYLKYIKEHMIFNDGDFKLDLTGYCLTDIDKDGIPEMYLHYGMTVLYSPCCWVAYRNGKAERISEYTSGGSNSFHAYPDGNGVLDLWQRQITQRLNILTLENGKIERKNIGVLEGKEETKNWISLPYTLDLHVKSQNGKYVVDLSPFL